MAEEYPGVIPMLSYEDCAAALDWLTRAFGFRERTRMAVADGRTGHAEREDAPHGRLYRAEDLEGHRWMFLERAV